MAFELEDVNIQAELDIAEKAEKVEKASPEEKTEVVEAAPEEKIGLEEKPEKTEVVEEKKAQKTVPLTALHEARKEAKELKEEFRRKDQENAARYAALEKRLSDIQNPPAEKPAFETDPAGFLKNEVDDLKKTSTQIAEQTQKANLEKEISNRLQTSEAAFSKDYPDYIDAAQHLVKIMTANMEALGVSDAAQRNTALQNEILQLTVRALRNGKEPAELIYALAKNQGFTGKTQIGNTDKLETIAKGQEASATLGSGGRADAGKLTLDSLSKMDDDDFNALVLDEKKWKQIGQLMH